MFCNSCGKDIPDNSQSCRFCGQAYVAIPIAAEVPVSGAGVPSRDTLRRPLNSSTWSRFVLGPSRKIYGTLERGTFIRNAVVISLRVTAILLLLIGILLLVEALKLSFGLPTAQGTVGGLILSFLSAGAIAACCQVLLYRAETIGELGESSFTVIPILSILMRAMGEIYAVCGVAIGVGGCLFIWISGESPSNFLGQISPLLPSAPSGGTFLDGVILLAWTGLGSFGILLLFYFLAEVIVIAADIARNVRLLVNSRGAEQ